MHASERLPVTAQNHFLLHFYAAVAQLLAYVDGSKAPGPDRPDSSRDAFLAGYREEVAQIADSKTGWAWWEETIQAWEAGARGHLPLLAVNEAAGLDVRSRIALLLIGLPEVDSRFGTLFAELQVPVSSRRPTLETLGHVLASDEGPSATLTWEVIERLIAAGLVEVVDPGAPRAEWLLRIPPLLWDLVQGRHVGQPLPWCKLHLAEEFPRIEDLPLSDFLRDQLGQVPAVLAGGAVGALILRGQEGSERLRIAGAIAAASGRGIAEISLPASSRDPDAPTLVRHVAAIAALAAMARALPVVALDLGPGETVEVPSLAAHAGGLVLLLGNEGGIRGELAERAMTITIPPPRRAERERVWREAFADVEVDDLEVLVDRYHLPTGFIRQVAHLAVAQAALGQRTAVTAQDVAAASRSINRQQLDTLAARIEVHGGWADLALTETTASKLRELELRCHQREALLDRLGPAFSTTNRGVRALFSGASGTGKTLAAGILASVLGVDLYRVDLSAVVNKYIGETEKNLNKVLSRAEELDVVLLLDEGDSLLGNRTDVKSANDRYANLETNYLLQRLESYQGIAVVTTNANQLIDRAFQRRIDVVVNFMAPGSAERAAIWRLHLPPGSRVTTVFLADVADRCSLTGGQIRNASLAATLLAVNVARPVDDALLLVAIESEYRKAGALCPLRDDGGSREHHSDLEAFVASIQRASTGGAHTR
jgi:hypothetical protein